MILLTKLFLIILSISSFAQSTKDALPDPADELWLRFYADSRGVYFYNIAEMSEENGTFINLKIKTNFRKPELMPGIEKEIFCEITTNLIDLKSASYFMTSIYFFDVEYNLITNYLYPLPQNAPDLNKYFMPVTDKSTVHFLLEEYRKLKF